MNTTIPIREKSNRLMRIIGPILMTQIALYLMTFFDIVMTGRYDTAHLGGVSVGSSLWMPIYTGLAGILSGLTPLIAHEYGARKKQNIRPLVQQGLYISIALALFIFGLIFLLLPGVIQMIDLEPLVREVAMSYLIGMSLGLFPLFAYTVFRSFFDALGATRVSMFIIGLTAPINIVLNYMLIYGKFGLPELGGAGAGYASGITYWIVFFVAVAIATWNRQFASYRLLFNWPRIRFAEWGHILKIGIPIGIAIFVETSIFSAVTLLMSNAYSTEIISAHQIALNFTSFLYMMPLSISFGVTIVVGQSVGAKAWQDAKEYSFLAVGVALLFSLISIMILLTFRHSIASIYTADAQLIMLSAKFFIFSAFFQLSDAVLAPIQGALRGYKDVNATFITAIISFWVIGLPVGYVMATYTSLGPYGYWVGLITGLTLGAIGLFIRLRIVQRKVMA